MAWAAPTASGGCRTSLSVIFWAKNLPTETRSEQNPAPVEVNESEMKPTLRLTTCIAFAFGTLAFGVQAQTSSSADYPPVSAPPESFFQMVSERDRDVARQFYNKYIDVKGMPVVAAAVVADQALQRAAGIVLPDGIRARPRCGAE